eukprot:TRINITY_DN3531_c0_g1_i2.p1 TRINITY_DN3531_c0_g1~~TRINITY_DN3531_c0_g1_i2.p1  ORF type:complete len:2047 (-),score=557.52 TRINITY_DN3531_c0_g1_i2:8-6148(-)
MESQTISVGKNETQVGFNEEIALKDDVQIVKKKRNPKHFLNRSTSSKALELSTEDWICDDVHISDCVETYVSDFTVVEHANEKFGGKFVITNPCEWNKYPELVYEVDGQFFQDEENADHNENIASLFDVFPIAEQELVPSDTRTNVDPDKLATPNQSSRYVIECKELVFGLGEVEPLFCSIFIFDAKKKRRASETFHFSLNGNATLNIAGTSLDQINPVHKAKEALVTLSECTPQMYIVVAVEKVLQGNIDSVLENYVKFHMLRSKEKAKIEEQIKFCASTLMDYRQLLAFGVVELFDETGDVLLPRLESPKKGETNPDIFTALYSVNVDLLAAKNELNIFPGAGELDLKRTKVITGSHCNITVKKVHPEFDSSSNPTLLVLNPSLACSKSAKEYTIDEVTIQKELQEFPVGASNLVQPYNSYSNNMYIYPQFANLSSTPGRNISVKMQVFGSDEDLTGRVPLDTFYSADFRSENILSNFYTTTVGYHHKRPRFIDEIKLKLPFNLEKFTSVHVLFSFYHVSCKAVKDRKKKDKEPTEVLLGHSVLPLFPEGRIIKDDEYQLPIFTALIPNYLTGDPLELKYLEAKKPLFTLRTKAISTIFSQDVHLCNYFRELQNRSQHPNEYVLDPSRSKFLFDSVAEVAGGECVRFFPVLMNELLGIMSFPLLDSESKDSFLAINGVLKRILSVSANPSEFIGNSALLQSYAAYHFSEDSWKNQLSTSENSQFRQRAPIFQELTVNWLMALRTASVVKQMFAVDSDKKAVHDNSWMFARFFFDLIAKSMTLHVEKNFKSGEIPRSDWYSKDFMGHLNKLLHSITDMVLMLAEEEDKQTETKILNYSLALFVKDLFSIMDWEVVFSMIESYNTNLSSSRDLQILHSCKIRFFQVVADYEHYVPLNKPPSKPITALQELKSNFTKNRLCVLILRELNAAIASGDATSRQQAIAMFTHLLRKHDLDPRYQTLKDIVAGLYFPYLLTMIDNIELVEKLETEEQRYWLISFIFVVKNCDRRLLRDWFTKETRKRQLDFFKLLLFCVDTFTYVGKQEILSKFFASHHAEIAHQVSSSQRKQYIEAIYDKIAEPSPRVTKLRETLLQKKNRKSIFMGSPEKRGSSRELPQNNALLDFPQMKKSRSMNFSEIGSSLSSAVKGLRKSPSSPGNNDDATPPRSGLSTPLRGSRPESRPESYPATPAELEEVQPTDPAIESLRRGSFSDTVNEFANPFGLAVRMRLNSVFTSPVASNDVKQQGYLCKEVSSTVLNILVDLIRDLENELRSSLNLLDQSKSASKSNPLVEMEWIVRMFVALMKKNQSQVFLNDLFAALANFAKTFSKGLFTLKETNQFVADLTYEILKYCNSSLQGVRKRAHQLLYQFVKLNQAMMRQFTRMKLHMTVNISKLVGEASREEVSLRFDNLRVSLEEMMAAAKAEQDPAILSELQPVVNRLFVVLDDSVKIAQYRFDPEMTADLYYQISNGYKDSPELRVTWLETLYAAHLKESNWEEAGHTLVVIAALCSQYVNHVANLLFHGKTKSSNRNLVRIEFEQPFVVDQQMFKLISPNIATETPLDLSHLEEGMITSSHFTLNGVVSLLRQAVEHFKKSDLFESAIASYNILVIIHQKTRDYDRLSLCYEDLHKITKSLIQRQNARMFAAYYRVALYGQRFEELNMQHFIYKEHRGTIISDVVEKLKNQLSKQIGNENVQVLPNTTSDIDLSQLDLLNKSYFQVISVQPYLSEQQIDARVSAFDQKFNIDEFIFETPFTKKGGLSNQTDDVSEQFKRKTIIKTEIPFPYLKKRFAVTDKREIILSPIEVATELIVSRCNALRTELNCIPPNLKTLQIVLQGSVLAQVNAGPIRICEVFLGRPNTYPKEHLEQLRESIHQFVTLCGRAVELNGSLIKDDQLEFQLTLEQGFQDIKLQLQKRFGEKVTFGITPTLSTRNLLNTIGKSVSAVPLRPLAMDVLNGNGTPPEIKLSPKEDPPTKLHTSNKEEIQRSDSAESKNKRLSLRNFAITRMHSEEAMPSKSAKRRTMMIMKGSNSAPTSPTSKERGPHEV